MARNGQPKPVMGYPSRSAAAAALAAQGLAVPAIARRLSEAAGEPIPVKNVHALLDHARRCPQGAPLPVTVAGETHAVLRRAAAARGLTARALAARLLAVAAAEGMIDAVLDDGVTTPVDSGPAEDPVPAGGGEAEA